MLTECGRASTGSERSVVQRRYSLTMRVDDNGDHYVEQELPRL